MWKIILQFGPTVTVISCSHSKAVSGGADGRRADAVERGGSEEEEGGGIEKIA